MCPFTNETNYGCIQSVQEDNFLNQLQYAFQNDSADNYNVISIYNDGSFFCENDLPNPVRQHIYNLVASSSCDMLVVESSPQFINANVLKEAREALSGKNLSVGIGLQSSSTIVRELCINTQCSEKSFRRAIKLLRDFDCITKIYILIKPPFLTEAESIKDAISSARYVYELDIGDVTFCPVRVSENTVVAMLHSLGMYKPPWLWSVIQVLKDVSEFMRPRVACLNLRSVDFESIHPTNCNKCSDDIVDAIERANETGDIDELKSFDCRCFKEYIYSLQHDHWGEKALQERIEWFLSTIKSNGVLENTEK